MKNILDKNMFFAGLKAVILAKFGDYYITRKLEFPQNVILK